MARSGSTILTWLIQKPDEQHMEKVIVNVFANIGEGMSAGERRWGEKCGDTRAHFHRNDEERWKEQGLGKLERKSWLCRTKYLFKIK
jgi:hypothetical protein